MGGSPAPVPIPHVDFLAWLGRAENQSPNEAEKGTDEGKKNLTLPGDRMRSFLSGVASTSCHAHTFGFRRLCLGWLLALANAGR